VPSCKPCNNGASKDDEYFRLTIAFRHDIDHPDALVARESAFRSLERPQARGLLTSFTRTIRQIELRTPSGLYLGTAGTYDVDSQRLCRVAQRTALGLFYRDLNRRLPLTYEATTTLPALLTGAGHESYVRRLMPMVQKLLTEPPRFVGRNVLSYWRKASIEDPNSTISLLRFYDRVDFITITTPRG
jgi:hypothetical protein